MRNDRPEPIEIAAWSITQLALGGVAVAPLRTASVMNRHQPDPHLALWPYTSWQDERLFADDDHVRINAQPDPQELKIGLLAGGWLGYLRSGVLFLKRFDPQLELLHPDLNTNAQLYCNHRFLELESLAPLAVLEPGQSSVHVETWEIYQDVDVTQSIGGLGHLIRSILLQQLRRNLCPPQPCLFPIISCGVLPLRHTRSKARGMKTAAANRSGIASAAHLARSKTAIPATWPAITIIAGRKISN